MANWNPQAAKDLMAFAANHDMTAQVAAFEAHIDAWANGLNGHASAYFDFGRYTADVTGNAGQVLGITFDM